MKMQAVRSVQGQKQIPKAAVISIKPQVPVQRKAGGCSCGGGCPACKENEAAEREADAVAEQVLQAPVAGLAAGQPPIIQRKAAFPGPASLGAVPDAGPSRPFPGKARSFFETRFGTDFSTVRVHDGPEANQAARSFNARAYTTGADLVFAKGEFAPGTERGDRLLAHELTHVIQQRQAGPTIQRAASDFEITGRQTSVDDADDSFFFEKESKSIHADELKKIPTMVGDKGKDLVLKGFRSRDEARGLELERAEAAEAAFAAKDPSIKTTPQAETDALTGFPLYRYMRRVLVRKNTPSNAEAICPKGAEKVKKTCPTGEVNVSSLFRDAEIDVVIARAFVEAFVKDPQKFPWVGPKLDKYFGKGPDTTRIVADLQKLQTHIATLAGNDMGRRNRRPGYRCATICLSGCQSSEAFSQGEGAGNRITLCPKTWEDPPSRLDAVTTLIHEATHGTLGIGEGGRGTSDVVYRGEKVIPFLSADEALNSADVIALFVEDVIHGGKDKILPQTTDDVSAIKDPKESARIEEGLARLAKWLSISLSALLDVHPAAIDARRSGWSRSFERGLMTDIAETFGLPKPPRRPGKSDIGKIAGITDRIYLLEVVANKHVIRVEPESWIVMPQLDPLKPVQWTKKAAPDPARMPGLVVKVDPDLFGMFGVDAGEVRTLLEAMVEATPSIPVAHAAGYIELIDRVRKKKDVGP